MQQRSWQHGCCILKGLLEVVASFSDTKKDSSSIQPYKWLHNRLQILFFGLPITLWYMRICSCCLCNRWEMRWGFLQLNDVFFCVAYQQLQMFVLSLKWKGAELKMEINICFGLTKSYTPCIAASHSATTISATRQVSMVYMQQKNPHVTAECIFQRPLLGYYHTNIQNTLLHQWGGHW